MSRLILHDNPDPEAQALARARRFMALSTDEKMKQLFALIRLSIAMNEGKPLREPQGKGFILRKLPV